MKEQLIETWRINNQMNLLLLDNISETSMQKTLSTRGGRTIYLQWVHIHNVRMQWMEICAKDIFKKYKVIDKAEAFDRNALHTAFENSGQGVEEMLGQSWDNGGKVKGFSTGPGGKKGVIPMLGYFISHESHHRGNMLLTLKQCGEKIPDAVKWGLWEWY